MKEAPASRRLRIGFVGGGPFGQVAHLANFAQREDCQVVALANRHGDLRAKLSSKWSIGEMYDTHHDLLTRSAVDAVVVVTSRATMGPIVLDCLNAGRHVLAEKPMAGSAELAKQLVDAAAAQQVKYAVGYMKRHDAGVQLGKTVLDQLISSGEIGELTLVRSHCFAGDAYSGADMITDVSVSDEPRSGGLYHWAMSPGWVPAPDRPEYERFLNVHCHSVNLLRFLLGNEVSVVHAQATRRTYLVTLDVGQTPGLLELGLLAHADWDEAIEFYFEAGRLRITLPAPLRKNAAAKVALYRGGSSARWEQLETGPTWSFTRQAAAFVADVQHDRQPIASGADSIRDLVVIESIWRRLLKIDEGVVA